ncbi:hypothetical protein SDC9_187278 [bioreactor metagenome]|uniref:Uncharacterized protein n=1 Tax=bioreactor metagenome TaxID=1076179 RepID=A0A645HND3_9ZZZZ
MQCGIKRFVVTTALTEIKIFAGQNSFAGSIVRVHAFPATRQSTTMENNHDTIIVGINQNIFVKFHGHLFVASEEIHFDTFHSNAFHPCHFFTAGNGIVHYATWALRRIIPVSIGVVP